MAEVLENKRTAQQDCIEQHNENWLVIAGPGTGKTYTITKRIQKMLDNGIKPEFILCLTFSETASKEMKNRVGNGQNIDIFTFHSFCKRIMDEYREEFDTEQPKIISDSYKRTLISECISEREPVKYNNEKGNPYRFVEDILNGIEEIKKSRLKDKETLDKYIDFNPMWRPRLEDLKIKAKEEKDTKEQKRKEKIAKNEDKIEALLSKSNPTQKDQDEIAKITKTITHDKNAPINLEYTKALQTHQLKIERMDELWDFYEMYKSKMEELHYIDFNDMINKVLERFEDNTSSLLETVAGKYKYIIVDEYQDTNTAQNDIVFNLAKYCPNVFVVGDDDQIIYTFQGAHLDTLEKFSETLNPHIRCFDENYRSTQPILDVSMKLAELQDTSFNEFMSTKKDNELADYYEKHVYEPSNLRFNMTDDEGNKITKELISSKEELQPLSKPVELYGFKKADEERDYIVKKIISIKKEIDEYNEKEREEAKKENRKPNLKKLSEIAILTRKNKELKDFADYLKANKVPVEMTGGKNIFEITPVNLLISYMQALTNPERYKDKLLSFMLAQPFHINPKDYEGIWKVRTHYSTLVDCIEGYLKDPDQKIEKEEELREFVKTYRELRRFIYSEDYKMSIFEIGDRTGIFNYYLKEEVNKLENIKGIKKLIDTADVYFEVNKNDGNSFTLFVEYLSNLMDSESEIRLDKEDEPLNAVQLSTYHSSKGREFAYVFMPYLTSDKLDTLKIDKELIPTKPKVGEMYEDVLKQQHQAFFLDRIKLLYVGMSRAKHTLVLSYTGEPKDKDKYNGLSWFIKQIAENPKNKNGEIVLIEPEPEEFEADFYRPKIDYKYNEEFKDFIEINIPNKFSITSLNTYRKCPKQYFFDKILNLKVRSGNKDDMSYGSALHLAFEKSIQKVMTKDENGKRSYLTNEEALKVFEDKLKTLEITNPQGAKASAGANVFSKGVNINGDKCFYEKFKALVNPDDIEQDAVFEKSPVLDNKPSGKYKIYAEVPLNVGVNIDGKDVFLIGYVDRLDKKPDGTYTIYDYKTKENCQDIAPSDDYFYQMVFYKYVLEKQYPGIEVSDACFILPIEKNGNNYIKVHYKMMEKKRNYGGVEYTCSNYEYSVDEINKAIGNILDGQFEEPEKPDCQYCGYKYICKDRKTM